MWTVVRRRSMANPTGVPASQGVLAAVFIGGFVISWLLATYLGLYVFGQMGSGEKDVPEGAGLAGQLVSLLAIYTGGLWGALLPYRVLARTGRIQMWNWLLIALVYGVLFYGSTKLIG